MGCAARRQRRLVVSRHAAAFHWHGRQRAARAALSRQPGSAAGLRSRLCRADDGRVHPRGARVWRALQRRFQRRAAGGRGADAEHLRSRRLGAAGTLRRGARVPVTGDGRSASHHRHRRHGDAGGDGGRARRRRGVRGGRRDAPCHGGARGAGRRRHLQHREAADAVGHRPGRPSARTRHRGGGRSAGRGGEFAGPSRGAGDRRHQRRGAGIFARTRLADAAQRAAILAVRHRAGDGDGHGGLRVP